jgi:CheY-like chemotaxis protein
MGIPLTTEMEFRMSTIFDAGVLRHRELSRRFDSSPSTTQERVLVVDDSSDGRRMIAEILGCLGMSASVAEGGRAAVVMAMAAHRTGHPYDLILMDSQMPEVDGYQATTELRSMGYDGKIVALMSESIFGARYDLCAKAGCDGFASKPVTFPMLRDIIRRHLPTALQGCSRKLA